MAARNRFSLPLLLLAIFLGLLSSPCAADEVLIVGQRLSPGQALVSCGYTLVMQTDCNLVLYDAGEAVWSTHTSGQGTGCYLTMQMDGNLVIYSNQNEAVWTSNSPQTGNHFYVLALQRDRNVVIYGPAIWATGTNKPDREGVTISDGAQNAAKNENLGAAVVVPNAAAAEGEPGLGRKIDMVTSKA